MSTYCAPAIGFSVVTKVFKVVRTHGVPSSRDEAPTPFAHLTQVPETPPSSEIFELYRKPCRLIERQLAERRLAGERMESERALRMQR